MLNVELNVQISTCRTVDEVLDLVSHRGPEFNVVNCVTALQRIAKLPDGIASCYGVNDDRSPISSLLARTTACFSSGNPSKYDKPQPRHVAGALWACAKSQLSMEACCLPVRAAVAAGAALNPAWYKPQELSMVVWALGKLASKHNSISRSTYAKIGHSSSASSSGSSEGLSVDDVSTNQRFVATLTLSAMKHISEFDSQGLANMVQGAAGVGFPDDAFCPGGGGGAGLAQKLTSCLLGKMESLSSQELANVLAGLAKLEVSLELVPGLATERDAVVNSQMPNFTPQQLANVAWALAKLAVSSSVPSSGQLENHAGAGLSFWAIIAPTLTQRAHELNSQELSMCCWAASTSLHGSSTSSFDAVSTEPAAVAALVQALGEAACNACVAHTLHVPQQVSTIVLALAKLGTTSRTHLAALSRAARKSKDSKLNPGHSSSDSKGGRLGEYGWIDLDNLASGFARHELQWRSPKLVKGIAIAAANLLSTSPPKQRYSHDEKEGGETIRTSTHLPPRSVANVLTSVAKMASTCKQLHLAAPLVVATCQTLCCDGGDESNDYSMVDAPLPLSPVLLSFNLRDCANAAWGLGVLSGGVTDSSKDYAAVQRCVASLGQRGASCLGQQTYGAQECSRLLYALSLVNVRVAALETAAGASRLLSFGFPEPVGQLKLTQCFAGTQRDATQREATGTIAGNGGALFEDAPVLAHFLAKHPSPALMSKALLGDSNGVQDANKSALIKVFRALKKTAAISDSNDWSNVRCLELGAGLGLCSMVCTRLGMRVVATDGDASVLEAMKANTQRDSDAAATATTTSKLAQGKLLAHLLQWGDAESIEQVKNLGSGEIRGENDEKDDEVDGIGSEDNGVGSDNKSFDLIIATGCVYGREVRVWQQLVDTLVALSTPNHTLVLFAHGTGAAPGTHALRGEFYALADPWFYVGRAPPMSSNHADHPGVQVHYLVRRPEADAAQGSRSKRPNKETRTNSEVVASKNKKKKMHAN